MRTRQRECLKAETTADKDARLQQISTLQLKLKGYQLRVPMKETSGCIRRWVAACQYEDWQLKLPLKEMPDFTANERQTGSAEKEMQVWNVTEQDMGNNRMFSRHCLFFSSVPSKPRCINPMQAWLHWIYQPCFQTLPCALADKG